jgi:hypothetical protein
MIDWRYARINRALLTALQPIRRTEPDLNLVKQVEQVTTFVLEGPAGRFARIRSIEITGGGSDPRVSNWQSLVNCTPSVRQKNEDRVTGIDCARMEAGRTLAEPAKRKRALLGSNPPRNSRPETHGDAAGAGG